MAQETRVLLIGEDGWLMPAVRSVAEANGIDLTTSRSLSEGLARVAEGGWAATILRTEATDGELALVERLAGEMAAGAVVAAIRAPSATQVMEAIRRGARDVLADPVDKPTLVRLLAGLGRTGAGIPLKMTDGSGDLVGHSPNLLDVFKQVARVGPSATTVLITGESGTGKELVAQAVHRLSPRASRPFIPVNCAAIPEDLLESELFGHERGAFTGAITRKIGRFERADGGTLFLDEIGDMSLVLQAKILRALQEREVERVGGEERIRIDVRIVAATHRDLSGLIASEDFREDLYYRLAVVRLHLAPLRERRGDVRELALHYGAKFANEHGRRVSAIATETMARLEAHRWPGNVRELRNVMERAVIAAPGDVIEAEHVQLDRPSSPVPESSPLPGYAPSLSMADVEALHLRQVLAAVDGHVGHAAEILGLHRNTVSRKAREYRIEVA